MNQEFANSFKAQKNTSIKWRSSTVDERISRIKLIEKWIKTNQQKIREAVYLDFKKPFAETDLSEIYPVTSEINHAVKNLKNWMKPTKVSSTLSMAGTKGRIIYEPKGTSLIISPWNYPFNLAVGPLISALAAGCTAIIKPSELTPHTSLLLQEMVQQLFKDSEVAVFTGDAEVSQELLKLPFDHIFFTGSPRVGKLIMKAASEHLSSVTLELGGKSPAIVHQSADLKDTAEKIISGKFLNCGQTCIAPDYLVVHESAKDHLLMELKIAIQKMYDSDYKGIENSKDLARIINVKNFERLNHLIQDALDKGAKIEFGASVNPDSLYIEPTILSNLNEQMHIMEEEIFGPILPVLTFKDISEVIEQVNSKPKPLALYYFGQKDEDQEKVLNETSSGNAVINDCVLHYLHPNLPFGGVNNSGLGKAHGYFGYLSFSNEKGILKQRVGFNNSTMVKPPYDGKTKKIISTLIKWL
ncbi:aldehyde dehydrogenase family protein [Algoriphagus pacificus]|uniref:Aldehyde dehydrogenase n=1 Tax=Algoriphagus pacificus TaxID=2811234 RepID=A0ABS3CAK8_9BACT|nr:aldehyde dehydrogenase family protein [Algoriphagus pacificus]MBN7814144.1 aldehyde dehydrogenase family protein [Algoriphagus pacificus]